MANCMRSLILAGMFVLCVAVSAGSQTPAQPNDEIVVHAQAQRAIRAFVGDIAAAPSATDQLARWDHHICPGLFGLNNREQAQFIIDRIALRAHEIGLETGGPGCHADIAIFVTPDANRFTREFVREFGLFVGSDQPTNSATLDQTALSEFEHNDLPVRWWHVSVMRSSQGFSVHTPENAGLLFSPVGAAAARVPRVEVTASRLSRSVREDFDRVVIVINAQEVAGVRLDALSDYVAMIALAQLEPNADTSGVPTILNLFRAGAAAPSALTDWDRAYLAGLYQATRNARSERQQQGEIRRAMEGRLNGPPAH